MRKGIPLNEFEDVFFNHHKKSLKEFLDEMEKYGMKAKPNKDGGITIYADEKQEE